MEKSYVSENSVCKLEISDELAALAERNVDVRKLREEHVQQLVYLMTSWTEVMQKEIRYVEDFKTGRMRLKNAAEAYEFWRLRHGNFETVLGQLRAGMAADKAEAMMVAKAAGNRSISYTLKAYRLVRRQFRTEYGSVVKPAKHSMDSIRVGIDAIVNAPLPVIAGKIAPLYNRLNMIWLTSNLFGRKKHMERLLESISCSIADRISKTLSVPDIFRLETSVSLTMIKDGSRVLDRWKAGYAKCKKDIGELSAKYFGRWAWEFDEETVFGRLNSIRVIVRDLHKIIEIIELKLTNPKVRYVFKNVRQTHAFIRECVTTVFPAGPDDDDDDDDNKQQAYVWKDAVDRFLLCFENHMYDKIAKSVNASPATAVDDFRALQFFEDTMAGSNGATKRLDPMYSTVLNRFMAELDGHRDRLKTLKSSARLLTDLTPAAGRIIVARDLYTRAKTAARVVESLKKFSPSHKRRALSLYTKLCEEIFTYENQVYSEWLRDAVQVEERLLRDCLLVFRDDKLESTFDYELYHVIDTAQHLHVLGFALPQVIVNLVDRQEQIKYNVTKINELVKAYNEIVDKIDAPTAMAMEYHFTAIKNSLRAGLERRCTYLSLNLPKFVINSLDLIRVFNRIYYEIKSYETTISEKLQTIENLSFFPLDSNDGIQDIFTTSQRCKTRSNENTSAITNTMSYVAEALDLIEITCFGIQTGHHVNMALFYEKYETALFDTLITMVSNNFGSLERTADGDRAAIVVHGWLVDDKFALVPNVNAVVGALAKAMEDTLDTLHSVPRWLRTTNVRCPVVLLRTADDDEWLPPYSFHDPALLRCERVVNAEKRCYDAIERIGDRLDGLVRRFEKFHFLIKRKDQPATDLFAATGGVPTLDDYADKLGFFAGLSAELRGQSYLDLGCVRVDYSEFNDQLIDWCEFWHSAYGHRLLSECDDMMTTFANNITTLTMELNTRFNNCQGLDMVEKAIKKTKETVFQADSVFQDVHKRFYFLKRHGITVPDRQWRQLDDLQRAWRNVHEEALTKSFCIEDAKTGLLEMVT